jgi:hypothetical protein
MARILEKLPDSSIPPWQPATPLTRIHDLHHDLLALLVAIVTSDGDDVEQGWLKTFGGLLTLTRRRCSPSPPLRNNV